VFPYLQHIGIYGFKAQVLTELAKLQPSPLENAESLEQLRWLENGYSIAVGVTAYQSVGIDTPEDLEMAGKMLYK
jgi:3-deoxy-manno-octulosonate cytidylyltransferase (CMP-KDO synthetase)